MNKHRYIKRIRRVLVCMMLVLTTAAGQSKKPSPQVVLLNLRLRGFEPPVARAKAGAIFLVVHNQTGRPTLRLRVWSNPGLGRALAALADIQSRATSSNSSILLHLTPGSYAITELGEEKWTCALTVE